MKRGTANAILIAFAFVGGGVVVSAIPSDLLDRFAAGSALSRIVPAAAPPLGATARTILVSFGGLATALATAFLLRRSRGARQDRSQGGAFMSFSFFKFAGFSRRKSTWTAPEALEYDGGVEDAPLLRRSDAHPDAPARSPLSIRRELGEAALPPVEDEAGPSTLIADPLSPAGAEDGAGLAMPRAPEPLSWETIQQEMERLIARDEHGHDEPYREMAVPHEQASPADLSIRELADRLERGLARRMTGEREMPDGTIADPAPLKIPEPAIVPEDTRPKAAGDLEEALATLRRLAARTD